MYVLIHGHSTNRMACSFVMIQKAGLDVQEDTKLSTLCSVRDPIA